MALPIISLLASVAPSIIRWAVGDQAGEVADGVADIAMRVTGTATPSDAVDALRSDPNLFAGFQRQYMAWELGMYQEETRRLEVVAATMRAEALSCDPYVRRWRPTWGYVTAATWAVQAVAITGCLIGGVAATLNGEVAAVTALLNGAAQLAGALTIQWGIALTVLGVAVHKRSTDKQTATGIAPAGLMDAVRERLAPKGG